MFKGGLKLEKKTIICTVCPIGCNITVSGNENEVLSLEGNKCKRGEAYATQEFLSPERILTTTVKINNYRLPVIPVRSNKAIPKELIKASMEIIKEIEIEETVEIGQVIIPNILDTGADIIITGY